MYTDNQYSMCSGGSPLYPRLHTEKGVRGKGSIDYSRGSSVSHTLEYTNQCHEPGMIILLL